MPRHGPIFPGSLAPFPFPPNTTGTAVSIQFTGLAATRELDTFFIWNRARNLEDFRRGLQFFDFGSQNWCYADVDGNIAYFTSGEFPLREDIQAGATRGNPPWFIRDGTGGNEWIPESNPPPTQSNPFRIVPPDRMPQTVNPERGFVVNANNDPIGNTADNDPLDEALRGEGFYLSRDYDLGFRAARVTELLLNELREIPTPPGTPAGDGSISFDDMRSFQADVNQLEGRRLAPFVVAAVDHALAPDSPDILASLVDARIVEARNFLASWSYNTPTGFDTPGDPGAPTTEDINDSIATTLHNLTINQVVRNTLDAALERLGIEFRPDQEASETALIHLLENFSHTQGRGASGINFFDDPDVNLPPAAERDLLLVRSFSQALDLLAGENFAQAFGRSTDLSTYRWGRIHFIIFRSFLDGLLNDTRTPGGGLFSLPPQPAPSFPPGFPTDGARDTVDVASFGIRGNDENGFAFGGGPNMRNVTEFEPNVIRSVNVIPGGQSGVVGNSLFGSQLDLWLANDAHPVFLFTDEVARNAVSRMVFRAGEG